MEREPLLLRVKNGWAAMGNGWAVHGSTKEEAAELFRVAQEWHHLIDQRVTKVLLDEASDGDIIASPPRSSLSGPNAPPTADLPGWKMNKFERIRLVRHLGFNTEDSVLVDSRADLDKHAHFLAGLNRFSVRTFPRAGAGHSKPHFPIVTRDEFQSACVPLLDEGYSLIVAKPIDPAEATLAGCIVRRPGDFLVEVALGPGTTRRVTHEGRIDQALELSGPDDPRCGPEIAQALNALTAAERRWANTLQLTDVQYEFSAYRRPVGWKDELIIFWEIHGLGKQDAHLDQFYRKVVAS